MRIGIDARELCGRATGVGRYLGGLVGEWAIDDRARRHEFILYAPSSLQLAVDGRRFPTRLVEGSGGSWWEQVQMPAVASRDHLDIFFSPGYSTPLFRRVPSVVAIHDVSFAAHPEWFSVREGVRRRWLSRQSALQARAIITISQFSKREIVERLGAAESNIVVIPPGITPPSVPSAVARNDARVLYVGSIFNRRHLPTLLQAFAAIARTHFDASLDIVGDNRSYPRQDIGRLIAMGGLNGRVQWHTWTSERELGQFYGAARAFAFLSEYEGLGLTPLEALSTGVPPLVGDTAVARESCGDAALYVPVDDANATTRALEQLLFDESVRNRVLAAASAVLARYSWPKAARETLALLERSA